MKNLFKISLLVIFIGILSGCSKDFLDKTPIGLQSTATFYVDKNNCVEAITACYDPMLSRHAFARNFWAFGDVASDDTEAAGEAGGRDQPDCQQIDRLNILQSNLYIAEFYKDIYQAIYRCNVAIAYIPQGQFDNVFRARLLSEARFLRAMYYFYLNLVYGGVRIVDHPLQPDEYVGTRNTVSEVLHFVEAEFRAAADSLPKSYDAIDAGRATKGSALSYLLKALVFESSYAKLVADGKDYAGYFGGCESKWSEATQVFEEIQALNVYSLEPNYADLWTVAGESSPEHVFRAVSIGVLVPGASIEDMNNMIVGCVISVYQSCRSFYDAAGAIQGNGRAMYGLNAPTYSLWNEYEAGDPRQDISIIVDHDSVDVLIQRVGFRVGACPSFASPTDMNNAKYDPRAVDWTGPQFHQGPLDIKMMRYADVLLLGAEAYMQQSNATEALDIVNQIRTRARNSGTSGAPANLSSITLSDIQHERRVELAMEAHRYFDLVRWGLAYDKINGMDRATDGSKLVWVKGKHEFFPMPESEISLNGGQMKQNPGY